MAESRLSGGRAYILAGVTVVAILGSAYVIGRSAGPEAAPKRSVLQPASSVLPPRPSDPPSAPPTPLPRRAPTQAPVATAQPPRSLVGLKPVTGPDRPPMAAEKAGPFGSRVSTGTSEVALTFDDGPDPDWTPAVLGLLRKYQIKATFCLIGVNVVAFPKLVAAIASEGHTLCNHSWVHDVYLGSRGIDYIRADLMRTSDAIRRAAGPDSRVSYYRQPGGLWTSSVVAVARQLGMTPLHWSVDPMDWRKPGAAVISQVVVSATHAGSIVLMHDGGGNRGGTVSALGRILTHLTSRYRMVALPPGVDPPPPLYVGTRPREYLSQ